MKKILKVLFIVVFAITMFVPFINVKADDQSRVQVINVNGHGKYSISGGSYDGTEKFTTSKSDFFDMGTSIILTAYPDEGYNFVGWFDAVEDEEGWHAEGFRTEEVAFTFDVSVPYHNLMPVFEKQLVCSNGIGHNNIWRTAGGTVAVLYENGDLDGNVYGEGEVVDYCIGDEITVKARHDDDFSFVGWYVSNVQEGPEYYYRNQLVSTDENYTYQPGVTTIEGIDEPINYITAVFEEIVYESGPEKSYDLTSADGSASVHFTFGGDEDFELNILDILSLTPEQVEAGFGVSADEFNELKSLIKNNVKDYGNLLAVYAITVDGSSFNYSDGLTLKLKLTDAMKKFNTLKFIYLDNANNFKVTEVKDFSIGDKFAEVELDHLSAYALVGTNVEKVTDKTSNPKAGDYIIIYILMLGLGIAGFTGTTIYKKRKMN